MIQITMEPASKGDLPRMATLHADCFAEAWDEAAFASLLATPGVSAIIAQNGRALAGFVLLRSVADEAEILTIAVSPAWRRQHIAQKLMAYAAAQASIAGARSLFLEVASDNEAAKALYADLSFRQVGRRPNYYRRDDRQIDGLILRLDLGLFT